MNAENEGADRLNNNEKTNRRMITLAELKGKSVHSGELESVEISINP